MQERIDRRKFIDQTSSALAAATALGAASTLPSLAQAASDAPLKQKYRAAAIGSTGQGGYGHRMDLALHGVPGVEVVAIADDNPRGLKAAGKRNGVDHLYTDYREMLAKEKLDLVSIGTRYSELHEEMVVNCANAGKHIYCEKPLATDLASADRMLAACEQNGVKLAVAVSNRESLAIAEAKQMVDEGRIGKLLRIRANGKDDRRGGGEDLVVLGYHMLDLMCLFAGDPQWTFAQVLEGDREITAEDGRPAGEPIGLVAGNCLAAMFGFPNQVHGYIESHRGLKGSSERFCIEIYGSEGIITARSIHDVMWFEGPVLNPAKEHAWKRVTTPEWDAVEDKDLWCRQQQVLDLLQAVEEDREPNASGKQLMWVQEMIQSIYVSHFKRARVSLPLKEREQPLT